MLYFLTTYVITEQKKCIHFWLSVAHGDSEVVCTACDVKWKVMSNNVVNVRFVLCTSGRNIKTCLHATSRPYSDRKNVEGCCTCWMCYITFSTLLHGILYITLYLNYILLLVQIYLIHAQKLLKNFRYRFRLLIKGLRSHFKLVHI